MKLVVFRTGHRDRLGWVVGEGVVPSDGMADVPGTYEELIAAGPDGLAALRRAAAAFEGDPGHSLADLDLRAPIGRPGKVVAIGRNYREHVEEEGSTLPAQPLVFAKFPSSIIGPMEPIRWDPGLTSGVDFEAELGVVIGAVARHVSPESALDHVLGYTCLNDVSARDLQFSDGQWVRAKSLDTFCPAGPWITTADEIDPTSLRIRCLVNGTVMQDASTADLIFGVAELISRLSHSFTLEPGDVIATGTPSGVGGFRTPPIYLADGDEVVVEIEGIGELRNTCEVVALAGRS